jgi:digeranylgeranylglycerophospholipid reductase
MKYDAIIVGGSFAGLSTASSIQGGHVLLIEKQRELGLHQKSTCGTMVKTLKQVGAQESILKTFDSLTFHSPSGLLAKAELPTPFCTFDYRRFCQSLEKRLNGVEVLTGVEVERVVGDRQKRVFCDEESYSGEIVVDCSGWRAVTIPPTHRPSVRKLPFGIEVEREYNGNTDSIHFFFGNRFVEGGYGWVFPVGENRARIGVGSFKHFSAYPALKRFLRALGVEGEEGEVHCGLIPCIGLREPIVNGIFHVGDSGGEVLPVSAEGIRTAIDHGSLCGGLISNVFEGKLSLAEAQRTYRDHIERSRKFYENLAFIQNIAYRAPDRAWDFAIQKLSVADKSVPDHLLQLYLEERLTFSRFRLLRDLFKLVAGPYTAPLPSQNVPEKVRSSGFNR